MARMVTYLCLQITWLASLALAGSLSANDFDLRPQVRSGQTTRTKVILEMAGKLKINASGKRPTESPIQVAGHFTYDERVTEADEGIARQSFRSYSEAEAELEMKNGTLKPALRPERELIGVGLLDQRFVLYSPQGPLTRDELDLIDIPANSLAVEQLLPRKRVKVGDKWQPESASLVALLGIDAISQQDISLRLDRVQANTAYLTMTGKIAGAIHGIATDMEISGKLNVDTRQHLVTWLAMTVKEIRAIGHAQPGFDVTARIRMVRQAGEATGKLTDEAIAAWDANPKLDQQFLAFESKYGEFSLTHDRRWRLLVDRPDVAIFRLVDRGDLIAQVNFSKLDKLPRGQTLTLEAYQKNIQEALGGTFGQFVRAENRQEDDRTMMRVEVVGETEQLPITWIYYHLAHEDGQRLTIVFTHEASLAEKFGSGDETLVSSIQFVQPPEPTRAAAAEPASKGSEIK